MGLNVSREDREADAIGKALAKALMRLEDSTVDPEKILDSALVSVHSFRNAAPKDALEALIRHYCGKDEG